MIAAKPRGKGAFLTHYYQADKDYPGIFAPVCQPNKVAYKPGSLNFEPDMVDPGVCPECQAIKEAELAHA